MKDQSAVLRSLKATLDLPTGAAELNDWLDLKDSLAFLDRNAHCDSLIINLSAGHLYVVSALVRRDTIRLEGSADLIDWNYDAASSWGVCASSKNAWIEEPISGANSNSLKGGEPIIIRRSFDGVPEYSTYFELSQRFAHAIGLHFVSERRAWCRLDSHGDIEDVVRIVEIPAKAGESSGRIILCHRETLAKYAELIHSIFVQLFDMTFFTPQNFRGWNRDTFEKRTLGSLTYRYGSGPHAAFARGFALIPLSAARQKIIDEIWGRTAANRYEIFITLDCKNKRIIETLCDPAEVDNYFVETGKPWQISPVFFRPEVPPKVQSRPRQISSFASHDQLPWGMVPADF